MILSTSCLNSILLAVLVCCFLCGGARAEVAPHSAEGTGLQVAVFPIENLSGMPAPLRELNAELTAAVKRHGIRMVDQAMTDEFIEKHQVRYLGGVDEVLADALKNEIGVDAVMVSTLELYVDVAPPKFSLVSRLVRLDDVPEIIWMDSVGIAGDDAPGILELGLIDDLKVLRRRGVETVGESLGRFLEKPPARKKRISARIKRKEEPFTLGELIKGIRSERRLLTEPQVRSFLADRPLDAQYTVEEMLRDMKSNGAFLSRYNPDDWYSSRDPLIDQERSVAIIPFYNRSTRKHAAELQALHLAKQLVMNGNFRVLELGVIRDKLLNMHVIMKEGISIPGIDLVSISLDVDLLLSGVVFDYLDTVGYGATPKVDFSMQMFDRDTKKILWSSHSHKQGDEGVYFFEYGRISTAGTLADRMCRALMRKLIESSEAKGAGTEHVE